MAWFVAGVTIAAFIYSLYMQSKMKPPTQAPGQVQGPTATEGIAIPAVFGTRELTQINTCWYGDLQIIPVNNDQYYYAGLQMGICHGLIDELMQIFVAGQPYINDGGTLVADDGSAGVPQQLGGGGTGNNIYVGPDSVLGGWELNKGAVSVAGTDAGEDDYMAEKLGYTLGPKYKGVASVVFQGGRIGTSPYLKPWTFIVKRIHTRLGGASVQWYDAKAEISNGERSLSDVWKYKVTNDWTDFSAVSYDDSDWAQGPGGIGNAIVKVDVGKYFNWPNYYIPPCGTQLPTDGSTVLGTWPNGRSVVGTKLWMRWNIGALPVFPLNVRMWHDDTGELWFNGTPITLTPTGQGEMAQYNSTAVIPKELINTGGINVIAYRVINGSDASGNHVGTGQFIYAGIQVGQEAAAPAGVVDMNPAHIIREALTDPYWGMGYAEANINDASFTAAADTLYNERLGMSHVWSSQTTIEDFLADILRHITGVLYVDRTSGQFVLKLIRNDYTYGDLTVLDESNVVSIESASRKQPGELVNCVTVTYSASTRSGDQGSVTIYEDGLIQAQGGIVSAQIDYPGITSQANAAKLALRDLRMLSTPLLSCTVIAARQAAGFNIGSPFVLNWPDLGINSMVMRVTGIHLGDGIDNSIKVECCEDVFFYPSQALTVPNLPLPSPVAPTTPLAFEEYRTAQVLDANDRGAVVAAFSASAWAGTGVVFSIFAQISPGVMERTIAGPLTADMFDGMNPFTGIQGGTGTGAFGADAWAVGRSFLALSLPGSLTGKEYDGPYVVDDIGGHWEEAVGGGYSFVATHARMHRDPDFSTSDAFAKDMVVQVLNGTTYGAHFLQMQTDNIVLGVAPMAWVDLGTTSPLVSTPKLLRADQFAGVRVSGDSGLVMSATRTATSTGSDFPQAFPMLPNTPGVTSIPAAPWTITPTWVTVDGGDVGATTTIGFKVYCSGSNPGVLFEIQSAPLVPGPQALGPLVYQSPHVSLASDNTFVLIPTLHTDSTTPVTLTITYDGVNAILLRMPLGSTLALQAPPDDGWFDVTIVDGVISGFGSHKHLRVHGAGPLVGVDTSTSIGGTQLTFSFVDACTVTAAGTPTSGAQIKTKKIGGVYEDMFPEPDDIIQLSLMTDSGSLKFWQFAGGSA